MRLRLTARARRDRLRIFDHLSGESPSGATNVMASLQRVFDLIERFPESGRMTDADPVRSLAVPRYPYLVFYRVTRDVIEVIHIRHAARRPWVG